MTFDMIAAFVIVAQLGVIIATLKDIKNRVQQ